MMIDIGRFATVTKAYGALLEVTLDGIESYNKRTVRSGNLKLITPAQEQPVTEDAPLDETDTD
jgi:hypothetical protein